MEPAGAVDVQGGAVDGGRCGGVAGVGGDSGGGGDVAAAAGQRFGIRTGRLDLDRVRAWCRCPVSCSRSRHRLELAFAADRVDLFSVPVLGTLDGSLLQVRNAGVLPVDGEVVVGDAAAGPAC